MLEKNYNEVCIEVITRGVQLDRIFIFTKKDVLDNLGRFSDEKALRILLKQQDDNVNVQVSWLDDWEDFNNTSDWYQNFVIFDKTEVCALIHGIRDSKHGTLLNKDPKIVGEYQTIFTQLWNLSCPLSEVLTDHPPVENKDILQDVSRHNIAKDR